MMFARAIGDENPIYFDAEYGEKVGLGGVIAPPTYLQASAQYDPDYGLRPRQGQPWIGSGRTPTGLVRETGRVRESPRAVADFTPSSTSSSCARFDRATFCTRRGDWARPGRSKVGAEARWSLASPSRSIATSPMNWWPSRVPSECALNNLWRTDHVLRH